jgi:hypothetical protein
LRPFGVALTKQNRGDEAFDAYDHSLELKPDATLQKTVIQLRARRAASLNPQ